MTEKIIPIFERRALPASTAPLLLEQANGELQDTRARRLHDLRISVTDRCNFRCVYCMPKEIFGKDYPYQPHAALLSFEEITRVARIFAAHGVEKLRLTGGEPLLRKNVERLIAQLAAIRTTDGRTLDLTLTTNGSLLEKKARALKAAGLQRITVSLDALDDAVFKRMNDVDFAVADVLRGIDAAHRAGLGPVKVNMVVKAGMNDDQIVPMARHFKNTPSILRFIEYMDVGASNGWKMDQVIASQEVIRRIADVMPLDALPANYVGETANRWRYRDGGGEIGVISSVTQAFCDDCSRARLSTEGKLFTCLFASHGHDLRALLRGNASDLEISSTIAQIWRARGDRYSQLRTEQTRPAAGKVEMSYIGG